MLVYFRNGINTAVSHCIDCTSWNEMCVSSEQLPGGVRKEERRWNPWQDGEEGWRVAPWPHPACSSQEESSREKTETLILLSREPNPNICMNCVWSCGFCGWQGTERWRVRWKAQQSDWGEGRINRYLSTACSSEQAIEFSCTQPCADNSRNSIYDGLEAPCDWAVAGDKGSPVGWGVLFPFELPSSLQNNPWS